MKRCYKCKTVLEETRGVGFKDTCPKCLAYLHCCRNCRYYAQRSGHCTIPYTEPVRDVEGPSYCDEFKFAEAGEEGPDRREKAKDAWEKLFGD
jgi:hypothetical protein